MQDSGFLSRFLGPSNEVVELALVLANLTSHAEEILGSRPIAAVIASPLLPHIDISDIDDAARSTGLRPVTSQRLFSQPHFLSTSYAASGHGLCENFENWKECFDTESWRLPDHTALAVTYNEDSLMVQFGVMRQARRFIEPVEESLINWHAGSKSLKNTNSDAEESAAHWSRIRETVLSIPYAKNSVPIDIVVLSGEGSDDEEFRLFIRETFDEYQQESPDIYAADTLTTNARGAAELAFRCQYDAP